MTRFAKLCQEARDREERTRDLRLRLAVSRSLARIARIRYARPVLIAVAPLYERGFPRIERSAE